MLTAIRQWVTRTMMKSKGETGIVKTLPNKDLIELNTQITAQRLMQNGFDPNAFKNADQVENAIKQIEAPKVDVISQGDPRFEGIMNKLIGKKGEVFDMQGNKIDPKSKIMGGKQSETEAEILARIKEENKKGIEGLKQKMAKEKARTQRRSGNLIANNMQRTKIGEPKEGVDYDYYKEILGEDPEYEYYPVKGDETEEFLEAMVKEDKAEMAYMKRLYDKGALDPEDMAQGGRAGMLKGGLLLSKGIMKALEQIKNMDETNVFSKLNSLGKAKTIRDALTDRIKGFKNIIKDLKKEGRPIDEIEDFKFELDEAKDSLEKINEYIKNQPTNRTLQAQGGRAGFDNGGAPSIKYDFDKKQGPIGPVFETNNPEEAAKEVIKRLIKVEGAKIPLTREGLLSLNIDSLNKQNLGGIIDLLGGELQFGVGRDKEGKGAGFTFRKQFKEGSGMTRRTFMKILGGAMAIPIVGKFLKLAKVGQAVKKVPVIKTADVPGKPEWFDQLVNKVITEGDDMTKQFATKEREIVHATKIDEDNFVIVTQDLDEGAVRVEYQSDANVFGETVQLQYKKPLPDESVPNPKAEFTTAESGPVGRQVGPDDYDIEVDEVGGTSIRDLDSDVSKLKEYATGQKPTMKELVQNIERRKKAQRITDDPEAQSDALIRRQGEAFPDTPDEDFASGGIARMLGE